QAPTAAPTFDLDDLNFLSNDTKKEEPQTSSPALDLSSLNFDMPSSEPVKAASNSTFDLDDLNFLANDTKKEEPKSNALPTLNLSDIVNSTNSSALDSAPLSAGKVDLNNTTMGLNISDYLNSMQKPEEKKNDDSFSLSNTIPPHSLNLKDLNLDNLSVSKNSMDTNDKKDSGVISIGKMLVDQNALEEIIKKAEKGGKAGLTTTQVITAVKGRSLDTLLVDINNVSGILGSIIVGKDGLVIANTMPDNIDKDLVGALTSSLFTNIDTQIKKMKKGNLKRLTVETGSGVYILTEIEMGTLVVFGQEGQKVNLSDIYKSITAVTGKK
ncbi:roadblock/LC7 domain-containing protein, partial [bacterium]